MTAQITIRGARLHNLKNVTLTIPKNQLVVLTGVSGSGKSTLGFDILNKEGQRQYLESLGLVPFGLTKPPVDAITGLSPSISVDQHLTNRSPRSTVGTATEVYTYLRVLFARLGHRPCPTCGKDVPPSFDPSNAEWESESSADDDASAPEETFPCPNCGAPIPEIGMAHFSFNKPAGACPIKDVPAALSRLQVLSDVGLGYLQLGQPATTLSGGEAQRVKLAKELGRRVTGRTLYLLDEPTTGLHLADTARLLGVLQRLVDAGNTVMVVEHNLELVKAADWVIDLGPEGGAAGGKLIAQGTPEQIAQAPGSYTGQSLREIL